MFGKLKEKLKSTLSVFSKKTQEEAEDIPKEEIDKVISESQPKEDIVEEKVSEPVEEKKEEPVSEEIPEKEIEEVKEESAPAEVHEEISIEKEEDLETEEEAKVAPHVEPEVEEEPVIVEETKTEIKEEVIETTTPVVEEKKKELVREEVEEKPKKSFFGKITQALTTKKISADKFEDLFWDLEMILLESNVSVKVIERIKEDLKEELVDKPLPRDIMGKIQEVLKNTLHEILSVEQIDLLAKIDAKKKEGKPFVIMFFGINGAGKTTSIAKLTHHLQSKEYSVVLAAGDTFRAAAIQQLEEHATKLGVKMIKHDYGSDAAAVAFDAVQYAEKNKMDVVLIDTAGRLHSNTNLMNELEKINRVANPDMKIFVGESITGNDCIEQAEKFNELVNLDGAILTKADIDENGGAPLSIAYTIKKPILFLGMGQEYKDLEKFNPELILERLGFN